MAKREVIDCDKCGKETSNSIRLEIPNGTTRESGGHKVEIYKDYETKDLCPKCTEALFKFMFRHMKVVELGGGKLAPYDNKEFSWRVDSYVHPSPANNDVVAMCLKFFGIKDKS